MLSITDDEFTPLHRGTRATIRAGRPVGRRQPLRRAHARARRARAEIHDGGDLTTAETRPIVDLDKLLNELDRRRASDLQGVIQRGAQIFAGDDGRARQPRAARTSTRRSRRRAALADELVRDQRALRAAGHQRARRSSRRWPSRRGDLEQGIANTADDAARGRGRARRARGRPRPRARRAAPADGTLARAAPTLRRGHARRCASRSPARGPLAARPAPLVPAAARGDPVLARAARRSLPAAATRACTALPRARAGRASRRWTRRPTALARRPARSSRACGPTRPTSSPASSTASAAPAAATTTPTATTLRIAANVAGNAACRARSLPAAQARPGFGNRTGLDGALPRRRGRAGRTTSPTRGSPTRRSATRSHDAPVRRVAGISPRCSCAAAAVASPRSARARQAQRRHVPRRRDLRHGQGHHPRPARQDRRRARRARSRTSPDRRLQGAHPDGGRRGGSRPFRSDARCAIQPEGLISENFVQCDPGHARRARAAAQDGRRRPSRSRTRPCRCSITDLFNIWHMPVRERFAVVSTTLGLGRRPAAARTSTRCCGARTRRSRWCAGRSTILNRQRRAAPVDRRRDTDRVVAELAAAARRVARLHRAAPRGHRARRPSHSDGAGRGGPRACRRLLAAAAPGAARLDRSPPTARRWCATCARAAPGLERADQRARAVRDARRGPRCAALGATAVEGRKAARDGRGSWSSSCASSPTRARPAAAASRAGHRPARQGRRRGPPELRLLRRGRGGPLRRDVSHILPGARDRSTSARCTRRPRRRAAARTWADSPSCAAARRPPPRRGRRRRPPRRRPSTAPVPAPGGSAGIHAGAARTRLTAGPRPVRAVRTSSTTCSMK